MPLCPKILGAAQIGATYFLLHKIFHLFHQGSMLPIGCSRHAAEGQSYRFVQNQLLQMVVHFYCNFGENLLLFLPCNRNHINFNSCPAQNVYYSQCLNFFITRCKKALTLLIFVSFLIFRFNFQVISFGSVFIYFKYLLQLSASSLL